MTERAQEVQSVSALREAGVSELRELDYRRSSQVKQLARQMILRMADGDPYTTEDFFFAATAGEYRKHESEHNTLKILEAIEPGEVVGVVTAHNKLVSVGIAAELPMELKVSAGYTDKDSSMPFYNTRLEAVVHLQDAFVASERQSYLDPISRYDNHTVPILERFGERDTPTRGAFYDPKTLLKGSEAILKRIAKEGETRDVKMLAGLFDLLGVNRFNA